jgi:hypothetical protein
MMHRGSGLTPDLTPSELHAPAQIHLLHLCKEALVEASDRLESRSIDEQCSACTPEHTEGSVVLAIVAFDHVEYAPPREGKAEQVEPAPSRAGIVEASGVHRVEQLRLNGNGSGLAPEPFPKRLGEPRLRDGVVVQEEEKAT